MASSSMSCRVQSCVAPRVGRTGVALVALALLVSCASSEPRRPQRTARKAPAVSSEPAPKSAASLPPARIAPPEPDVPADPEHLAVVREKGWSHLVEMLAGDGVSRARAARAFADPRMPAFDGLLFGLNPRESRAMYRGFRRESSMAEAERCAAAHAVDLRAAERQHRVDGAVVAAIMHVETHCGRNTGRSMVLHRLARLAMANEPRNVARNLARNAGKDGILPPELADRTRARARYLEGIFYPQVVATFEIARAQGFDPIALRGSGAGAFGYVQFLPLNYVAFGTDADGDGRVSLYEPADASASAARFLASYGWKNHLTREKKRQVIWHYNRSDAYIDTVLAIASRIRTSGALDSVRIGATEARALPVSAPGGPVTPTTQHP